VEAKGRLTVEEAITQAKIRRCPNPRCKQPFVKSDGCNKVACACGTLVCYVCRKAIKSYSHFCQTPHCTHAECNNCPLWTKAEEDDARAMREAGLQAASQVASTVAGVNINVDEILTAGTTATVAQK
jgi:TRIAD3 protein (E3 ubiquitin-protein ligase RNF216)